MCPIRTARPQDLPFVPAIARRQVAADVSAVQRQDRRGVRRSLAFRTAPLVSATTMDAKVTTSEMASQMMTWALFGKPNQREWVPSAMQKDHFAGNDGLYSSGYKVVPGASSGCDEDAADGRAESVDDRCGRVRSESRRTRGGRRGRRGGERRQRLFVEGLDSSGERCRRLADRRRGGVSLDVLDGDDLDKAARRIIARSIARRRSTTISRLSKLDIVDDVAELAHPRRGERRAAAGCAAPRNGRRCVLRVDARFLRAEHHQDRPRSRFHDGGGRGAQALFAKWLDQPACPNRPTVLLYTASAWRSQLGSAIIVYGTLAEAGANRYAAEQWQKQFLGQFESAVRMRKDFEVTDAELADHDVLFIGRPETNSALAAWAKHIDARLRRRGVPARGQGSWRRKPTR